MPTTFSHDDRLPYTVTSSVRFNETSVRLLRCTAKGHIASGAEMFDAPVIEVPLAALADVEIATTRIITPDRETTNAITATAGVTSVCIDDFMLIVSETAASLKADERDYEPLHARAVKDAPSSAFATAQRLYEMIHRQMPRVQAALANPEHPTQIA
jgi:hypothetical protein